MHFMISLSTLWFGAMACAEPIAPSDPDAAATGDAAVPADKIQTTRRGDGTYTTRSDASAAETWTYVDLETGVESEEPTWDLAAQRFHIKLDGGDGGDSGVSGDVGVQVVPLAGVAFGQVTEPPAAGWITDEPDGEDEDQDADYLFEQGDGWYAYDFTTHVLTPRDIVWVLETAEANHVKLVNDACYDGAGTSGVFTTMWAPLASGGRS